MYRSILVPLDGSPFAEQALPLALGIARRAGAALQLVRVHVPFSMLYGDRVTGFETTLDPAAREHGQAYLDGVARRLATAGVPVTTAFLEGTIEEVLHEQALARGADLMVMTTHGRGPLARAWLGSVADALVRRLPMPVLLVRPQNEAPPEPAREAALRHVLIALDGSPFAEQVLQPARDLGRLMQARYTLLNVIPPMVLGGHEPLSTGLTVVDQEVVRQLASLHEEERARAQAYLDGLAKGLREQGLSVQTRVSVHEQPAVAILDWVKAGHADLVALATHGRGGMARLFLGSVADKVIRGAGVSVLVHRPPAA